VAAESDTCQLIVSAAFIMLLYLMVPLHLTSLFIGLGRPGVCRLRWAWLLQLRRQS
jgi:hypothetical protein